MPGLLQIQTDLKLNPAALWSSNPNPEDVELWLPSSVPTNRQQIACTESLLKMELRLRTAQCSSSLQGLRQTLRVKTRMVYFKNKNIRGQQEGTRSRAIIDRVHKRAICFVQKYRAAQRAKFILEGSGDWENIYRELRNEDVRGFSSGKPKKKPNRRGIWEDGYGPSSLESAAADVDDENTADSSDEDNGADDDESDPDLNDGMEAGPQPKKKRKKGTGETRKELSWIWRTSPLSLGSEENDDILCSEWARSRARVRRSKEEVSLVLEEMRRVLKFLEWKAAQWDSRQETARLVSRELNEGIIAYAAEQAALQRIFLALFKVLWKTPLAKVERLLKREGLQEAHVNDEESNDEDSDSDDEYETA